VEDIEHVTTIITNCFEANNIIVRGEQEKVYAVMAWKKYDYIFQRDAALVDMSTKFLSVILENAQFHFYF
jgi:hypothetical protein